MTTYDPLPQFPGGTTQMVTEIYDSKGNLLGLFNVKNNGMEEEQPKHIFAAFLFCDVCY